jgi:hypothetical protein
VEVIAEAHVEAIIVGHWRITRDTAPGVTVPAQPRHAVPSPLAAGKEASSLLVAQEGTHPPPAKPRSGLVGN